MNFDYRIKNGDIFIERRFNWYMHFGIPLFPKTLLKWPSKRHPTWLSIHNGVFGTFNGREGLFESERHGIDFRFIDWEILRNRLDKKTSEFKILRHPGLTDEGRTAINLFLSKKIGHVKYDEKLFYRLLINGILRRGMFGAQDPTKWICTEVISESYKTVGIDLLKNEVPSPYAIEKLVADGKLIEIADFY